MAVKIADSREVSLDYLVGKTDAELNNATLKLIKDITPSPEKEKKCILILGRILFENVDARVIEIIK